MTGQRNNRLQFDHYRVLALLLQSAALLVVSNCCTACTPDRWSHMLITATMALETLQTLLDYK